jgi:hypothetical protein
MWRKQIRAEQAAEQASRAVAKAKALQEAALARPESPENEGASGDSSDSSDSSDGSETDSPSSTRLGQNTVSGPVSQTANARTSGGSIAGSNHETLVNEPEDESEHSGNIGQHVPVEAQPFNSPHTPVDRR